MPKALSDEQVREYERDGVLFPLAVLDSTEVERFLRGYRELEAVLGERLHSRHTRNLHLFHPWAYEVSTNSRLLDAVEDVLGPDLLVYGVGLFYKYPRDGTYVSWHQDGLYVRVDDQYLTAWVAMSDSSPDNGCMRVVRGSHRNGLHKHIDKSRSPDNMLQNGAEIAQTVEESEATDVVLRPGEMSFHHGAIVHGSKPNDSDRPRIGLAVRFVCPGVRLALDHIPVVLARGRDDFRHFRVLKGAPKPKDMHAAIRAQAELQRWTTEVSANGKPVPIPAGAGLEWEEAAQ